MQIQDSMKFFLVKQGEFIAMTIIIQKHNFIKTTSQIEGKTVFRT